MHTYIYSCIYIYNIYIYYIHLWAVDYCFADNPNAKGSLPFKHVSNKTDLRDASYGHGHEIRCTTSASCQASMSSLGDKHQ